MNVVNFMTDETGIMELRSREFKMHLLNEEVTSQKNQVLKWKLVNTLLPLVLILLAGLVFSLSERVRYT